MSYALVQSKISGAAADPQVVAYTGTPVAGNLMLASVWDGTTTNVPTVSDSNGNWTLLGSSTAGSRGVHLFGCIAVASQPTSITAVRTGDNLWMNLYEFSGNKQLIASIVNVTASTSGASGTTSNGPVIVSTVNGQLIFTSLGVGSGSITGVSFADGAFTAGQSAVAGAIRLVDYYYLNGDPTTWGSGFNWTTSRSWCQLTTALRPKAGGIPIGML